MRKQYYFRSSPQGLQAWDVDVLIARSANLMRSAVPLQAIRELDEPWHGDDEQPSWRAMVDHVKLIADADLAYPIILAADGRVMDGMHRVAKALLEGRETIDAVRFEADPPPDHVGHGPADLPY